MFFKEQIKKRIKNEKGLTLVELLAVIVILAIIAAIAIPAIGNIIANSRSKAVISDAQNIMSGAQIYFTDNPKATHFGNVTTEPTSTIGATVDYDASVFKEYVESPGGLTDIVVEKKNPNEIKFTAEVNGTKVEGAGPFTLDQLNKAEVKKGVIIIPASGSDTQGTNEETELGE